ETPVSDCNPEPAFLHGLSAPPLAPALAGPVTVVSAQTVDVGTVSLGAAGTITGTVVAAEYGYPVSSAVVTVPGTASEAITNYAGAFTLHVAPGSASVTATKAGWSTATVGPFAVVAGSSIAAGAIPLTRWGAVTGRVTADYDDSPIEGVTVTLSGGGGTGMTDSTGTFTISCAPGTYTATYAKAGFETAVSWEFTTWSGGTYTLWDTRLVRHGVATGLVTSSADGQPLSGVHVAVLGGSASTNTGSDGRFAITVPPTPTRLVLSKAGFGTALTGELMVGIGESTDVGALSLGAGGVLSGIVVSAGTGAPLAGVLVSVQPEVETSLTDASGAFSFELAPGDYSVVLSREGWDSSAAGPFSITAGATTDVGALPLTELGTIVGTVVRAPEGTPVAGAIVRMVGAPGTVTTDATGHFSIKARPGAVTLLIESPPYSATAAGPVTVVSAQTVDLGVVQLLPPGTLRGTVVGGLSNVPVGGATVRLNGASDIATTDSLGAFSFQLAAGTVNLTISKSGFTTLTTGSVTVTSGATTDMGPVHLVQNGSIVGRVASSAGGVPLEGATVRLEDPRRTATTAADGSFVLSGIPAGTVGYTVAVSLEGFSTSSAWPRLVFEGQATDLGTILLDPPGEVYGTILGSVISDATGMPVPGANVHVWRSSGAIAVSGTTDATGAFSLSVPVSTGLSVQATTTGLASMPVTEVAVAGWGTKDLGTLRLVPAGVISGKVLASDACTVCAKDTGWCTRTEALDGQFALQAPPGTWDVVAWYRPERPTTKGPVSVVAGETVSVGEIRVETARARNVTGKAVGALSGAPLADGSAALSNSALPPDSIWSGEFGFYDVPPGSYAAIVSRPGWLPATGPSFTVVAGSVADAGKTALERGGKVLGTVRDSLSGLPLANADVLVSGTGYSDRTDEYGGFLLSVPAGAHSLRILKEGWQTTLAGPTSVAVGSVVNLGYIDLVPESTAPGLVTGTVETAQGPAVGSRVQVVPGGASVLTDAQGAYSLSVPAGTVSIIASLDGWASAGRSGVVVLAGQTVPLEDLTLSEPAAAVSGRVSSMYGGAPIAGAVVTVDGTGVAGLTDATGAFSLLVTPGIAVVRVVATGWGYTESGYNGVRRLVLAPGQVASGIVLTLEPLSEVSGRIVDSVDGAPIAGARISTSASSTETDADGRFRTWEFAGPGGHCGVTKTGWSRSGDHFDVSPGQPVALGDLQAVGTGTLVGMVGWDHMQMNPSPVATVVVEGAVGSYQTDADGVYSITVPPGTYTVRASRSSSYDTVTSAPVSVVSGETMEVERIYLAGYGAAYGTVRDADTQLPLGGVTVSALETGASTVSDSAGSFSLRLRAGGYTIVFTKPGYVTRTATAVHIGSTLGGAFILGVDLTPESTFELAQLAIVPSYVRSFETATGTVIAKGPAPSGGATVTLISDNPSAVTMPATVSFLEGESTASFLITGSYPPAAQNVKITARHQKGLGWTETWAYVSVDPPAPIVLLGLSPATALPGDGHVVGYVESLTASDYTVSLAGPVYALDSLSAPLCDLASGACPTQSLPAPLEPGDTAVRFALPEGLGEGYYAVRVVEATGRSTSWGWMGVEARQRSIALQSPDEHRSARRLLPGQVVTGTFAENGDPNGNLGDYNFFYFIAPAGSVVNARLERVDTSLPWEAPSSLDPQLELIAPDGFIYANVRRFDDAAGSDLNATLTNAVLPQGGLWLLAAETTRGSGDYRLTFDLTPAPPAAGERAVPISGNGNTLPLGVPLTSAAIVLDPRGYPLSGATVTFAPSTAPENKGILQFASGNTVTSGPDGSAIVTATFTSPGKASLTPTFSLPLFANLVSDSPAMKAKAEIPIYEPVGRWPVAVRDFSEDTVELRPAMRQEAPPSIRGLRGESDTTPRERTLDAANATPLSVTDSGSGRVAALERISGCQAGTFNNAGVVAAEVHAPFTLSLEDLTPKPGESAPPGVLDTTEGINGHRIERTVRLRLDIKDATESAPTHPVLVQMAVGGPKAGKLILDPDGARIECTSVSFLWHDRDAQGKPAEKNEIVEYRLGEYAPLVGFKPDEQAPGTVEPVWGVAEQLKIALSAPDESGSETWERTLDVSYPVRPQPGKPDHFDCIDYNGDPCPDVFPFWTGYRLYQSGTRADGTPRLITEPFTITNTYVLADARGNTTWGYRNVSATDPSPSLTVGFRDQATTGPDFAPYALSVSWSNDPAFPQGSIPATLSVQYPTDPEWPAGTVEKVITLD
ncbi:MAG TPA: carboxypeptidase regulatory-like domain-containing protein, partial [Thermoanaerobaculia bacterium]|nr:carboxypeptidase regulatory-like domain-containing protein [Thermoanaerobaculia bacterium]